ncbi:MAG: alpha/beta hydrolase [Bacteroidota bacterium]
MSDSPIYAIPGLSVDGRIFQKLSLPLPIKVLEHKKQGDQRVSLREYAHAYADQIAHPSPILLGLSMGGMMAQELAQILPVKKLILLSTLKKGDRVPFMLQVARYIPLYQMARGEWRLKMLPYWAPRFGITDPGEQQLLHAMFASFDDAFRMWAVASIIQWEPPTISGRFLHLHGSEDHLFPASHIRKAEIMKGNHFMVYQEAGEVSRRITQFLEGM